MSKIFKNPIKKVFNLIGLEVLNLRSFDALKELQVSNESQIAELKIGQDRLLYMLLKSTFANKEQLEILGLYDTLVTLPQSGAQLCQDLFVLDCLKQKR